jgi:glucose 1-dehydrogenase
MVNIASIAGLQPEVGAGAYSASKAAVIRMTEQMAVEWAEDGVRVNNVCPGLIWTPGTDAVYQDEDLREERRNLIPTKRIGRPEDIAKATVFLLAPDNDYITGETMVVDGGAQCVGVTTQIPGIERTNLQ